MAADALAACHYSDVIMSMMASQITSVSIVCSIVCSGTDQRIHQRSRPHHWPLWGEFTGDRWIPHKGPVLRKMFPFDNVIMHQEICVYPRSSWNTWLIDLSWKLNDMQWTTVVLKLLQYDWVGSTGSMLELQMPWCFASGKMRLSQVIWKCSADELGAE